MADRTLPRNNSFAQFQQRLVDPLADPKPRLPSILQRADNVSPLDYSRKPSENRHLPVPSEPASRVDGWESEGESFSTTILMENVEFIEPWALPTPSPTFDLATKVQQDSGAVCDEDALAQWANGRGLLTVKDLFKLYRYFDAKENEEESKMKSAV